MGALIPIPRRCQGRWRIGKYFLEFPSPTQDTYKVKKVGDGPEDDPCGGRVEGHGQAFAVLPNPDYPDRGYHVEHKSEQVAQRNRRPVCGMRG